jgi:flagellar hook assembly protein FlgD
MKTITKKASILLGLLIIAVSIQAQTMKFDPEKTASLNIKKLEQRHETGLCVKLSPDVEVSFISFFIPEDTYMELAIYDKDGNKVQTLIAENMLKGMHSFGWHNKNLGDGIFYLNLDADFEKKGTKLIVQR